MWRPRLAMSGIIGGCPGAGGHFVILPVHWDLPNSTGLLNRGGRALTRQSYEVMMNRILHKWTTVSKNGKYFSTSTPLLEIRKLTRLKVVDNSALGKQAEADGKPARCIHIYNKIGVGTLGDKVLVAIKGQKQKAVIVGVKKNQPSFLPRHDTNNIVLINDDGSPVGTRIQAPIPSFLRKNIDYNKIIAIATTFV